MSKPLKPVLTSDVRVDLYMSAKQHLKRSFLFMSELHHLKVLFFCTSLLGCTQAALRLYCCRIFPVFFYQERKEPEIETAELSSHSMAE